MRHLSSPLQVLADSLYDAAYRALPDFRHETRDWDADKHLSPQERAQARKNGEPFPTKIVMRRPAASECTVIAMFPESWGSTALGFGGMGGAAITDAYTVVIRGPEGHHVVYWAGRFAYLIEHQHQSSEQAQAWAEDLLKARTASRQDALVRYGARLIPFVSPEGSED